jgi:hypothetical protein
LPIVFNVAEISNALAPEIHGAQDDFYGAKLLDKSIDLGFASSDTARRQSIDYRALDADDSLKTRKKALRMLINEALSNTGVLTRWMVEQAVQI